MSNLCVTAVGQITEAADDLSPQEASNPEAGASLAERNAEDGHSKKKRKPKKKAKKFPLLPSVVAAEAHLAWKLEQTTRLGRHAIAKDPIATGIYPDVHHLSNCLSLCVPCIYPLPWIAKARFIRSNGIFSSL